MSTATRSPTCSLDDPRLLVFGYVQHLAAVIDALPDGTVAVTHVGGCRDDPAALRRSTPAPARRRSSSSPTPPSPRQVRRQLPLPRGHRIRVRPQRGREGRGAH